LKKLKHIWVFSDSIKGHEVQSLALANALSSQVSLFYCAIRQPWLSFAPRLLPRFGRNIIWKNEKPDIQKVPDLIITCGRRMAAVGKFHKRQLHVKHIQVLCPGDKASNYDILVCPEHDKISGNNVITTQGSLHTINADKLAEYNGDSYANSVVLLLGNPGEIFFSQLNKLKNKIDKTFPKYNVIVCASRRTPKRFFPLIRQAFSTAQMVWLSSDDGKNPYMLLLAQASVFIVTSDSINMVSEACATDKPVITIAQSAISPKHQRFIQSIEKRLSNFNNVRETHAALNVLDGLLKKVRKRLS